MLLSCDKKNGEKNAKQIADSELNFIPEIISKMKLKQQIVHVFFLLAFHTIVSVRQPIYFILFFIFIRFGMKQNGEECKQ